MPAPVDLLNMALGHLAQATEVTDFDAERSVAARAGRRFYATARDQALRDFPWGFATDTVALNLVGTQPTTEWAFSYRVPADTLVVRRLLSGAGRVSAGTSVFAWDWVARGQVLPMAPRVPFRVVEDAAGGLVYTDQSDAVAEVTTRVTDTTRYPADFALALSYLLAALIAPTVTGGDPSGLGDKALKLYAFAIGNAKTNAANEGQPDPEPDASLIRGRD